MSFVCCICLYVYMCYLSVYVIFLYLYFLLTAFFLSPHTLKAFTSSQHCEEVLYLFKETKVLLFFLNNLLSFVKLCIILFILFLLFYKIVLV